MEEVIMEEDKDNVFIVFRGLPITFGKDPDRAEIYAKALCEDNEEDYTIIAVPRKNIEESGLVARYHGVTLHALQEIREDRR